MWQSDGKGLSAKRSEEIMAIILLVLLLAIVLGGVGFLVHALWIVAGVVLVVWLLGFVIRSAEGVGSGRGRWYRW
jgi:membrane protein YdbS with pleckstrin-like domain